MKGNIHINIAGSGWYALPIPNDHAEEEEILLKVEERVKALDGFDPYDSSLMIRVLTSEGEVLYSLRTGHAYGVRGRVEFALAYVKANYTDKVA